MDTLSVVIPVYNGENYVEQCVASVCSQGGVKLEVIAVDDGSTDASADILERLRKKYQNLIVLRQPNKGVSAARNLGLEAASGNYVTFVDADDTLNPGTYSYLLAHMAERDADTAIYAFRHCMAEQTRDFPLPWENLTVLDREAVRSQLMPALFGPYRRKVGVSGSVWRSVFKRDIVEGLRFDETVSLQEDLLFCLRAYGKSERMLIVNAVKYNYVKRRETTTERYRRNFYQESLYFESRHCEALKEIGLMDALFPYYQNKRVTMYSLCISNLFRADAPRDIGRELREIADGFAVDPYLKSVRAGTLSKRNRYIYCLLKCRMTLLLRLVYRSKEIRRRRKLQR